MSIDAWSSNRQPLLFGCENKAILCNQGGFYSQKSPVTFIITGMRPQIIKKILLLSLCLAVLASACQDQTTTPTTLPPPVVFTPSHTPTAELPTATLEPVFALVNCEGITRREFDAELARLQASMGGQASDVTLA